MKNKSLILAIFLLILVFFGSSAVFAEDTSDIQSSTADEIEVQEIDNIATISEINNNDIQKTSEHTIKAGSSSEEIQTEINSMAEGDTLNFEEGNYTDICIYVNKSITINGNGAKLIGYNNPSKNNVPNIITDSSSDGGYGIGNIATLYVVKADNIVINGLTIIGGANSGSSTAGAVYSNALLYAEYANNLTLNNNKIDGSSWGVYLRFSNDCKITNNEIKNQEVTGVLSFGSARTLIENNTVINAKNHGIDVRHGTGPNVQVINNTVIGSKEGIYLMHSTGHTATQNTIINCTISSLTCYGSTNINAYNNTFKKSRIGVLLGGGYKNITLNDNEFVLDNLPYPPTFVYFIAEAQADFQSATDMMGTHSDSSSYNPTYVAYTGIETPKDIVINYDSLLNKTGTVYTVPEGTSNENIQKMIDSMSNGDTLEFTKNAVYENISIYTNKNIKIIGNNATLIGYPSTDLAYVPEKVKQTTSEGGYAISERAVLYIIENANAVVSNLNIIARFPGYDTTTVGTMTNEYKTAGIRTKDAVNVTITDCSIDGASWGLYLEFSHNAVVTNNNIKNQFTTGILNFGTRQSILANNTITNVVNHGIDVRHGTGPKVTVFNNTISGAKEGIYLMHSQGHNVYNNTISNVKISGITCYGSGNENVFNNSISGSRIGILLGGGYYNVTIGENSYNLDFLPFPPTFVTYLAKAENKYYQAGDGTFSDKTTPVIIADNVKTILNNVTFEVTLTDIENNRIANQNIIINVNGTEYNVTTDNNGVASVNLTLNLGEYPVKIDFLGAISYEKTSASTYILVADKKENTSIDANDITTGYKKGELTFLLVDENSNPVANQIINVTIGENIYEVKTNEKGKVELPLDLTDGVYNATIIYAGTEDYYNPSNATVTITVNEDRVASVLTIDSIEGGFTIIGSLNDANGNPVSNATLSYTLNNASPANTNTDENGTFKIECDNNNEISITFEGNDGYLATSNKIALNNITSAKKDTIITVVPTFSRVANDYKANEKGGFFYAYLYDADGNPLVNKTVQIAVNGPIYNVTTDEKGGAGLQVNLAAANTYTYAISFQGDDEYNAAPLASTKLTLTAKKTSITASAKTFKAKAKTKSISVTLKTVKNQFDGKTYLSKGKTIKLTVNGKTYTAKTNAKGVAKFNIKLTKKGKYTAKIKFAGDKTYKASSKSIKVTIK